MARSAPQSAQPPATPGTPGWWTARQTPAAPSERRRGRPPRVLDDIIDVAAKLVDEQGAEGINLRLLAERLNTSTATFYRHVASKDELLVQVVDRLLGEVHLEGDESPTDWRDAMRDIATQYRSFLARHPNVLPLLVAQLPIGPNMLAIREQAFAVLASFDFSDRLAARAFTTVLQYVVGYALTQPGSPGPEEAAAIGDYYRSLDPQTYPHVVRVADALTTVAPDDEFLAGLQFVLDGIERARA